MRCKFFGFASFGRKESKKEKKAKRMPSDIGNTILPFMKETESSNANAVK